MTTYHYPMSIFIVFDHSFEYKLYDYGQMLDQLFSLIGAISFEVSMI